MHKKKTLQALQKWSCKACSGEKEGYPLAFLRVKGRGNNKEDAMMAEGPTVRAEGADDEGERGRQ